MCSNIREHMMDIIAGTILNRQRGANCQLVTHVLHTSGLFTYLDGVKNIENLRIVNSGSKQTFGWRLTLALLDMAAMKVTVVVANMTAK